MAFGTDQIMIVISAAAGGAINEMKSLENQAKKTGDTTETMGKKFGGMGEALKSGLVAGALAFVGTGLVRFLGDSVNAFADAAKAAGDLAGATGGTIDEVSRMQAALQDAGISAETSAGMLTKFTANAQKNASLLNDLNVEMVKGADGNTDYAATMVDAVDAVMKIGDAGERSRALIQLFGKQGAKAFQDLIASGVSLKDAMQQVSDMRVFDEEDQARAARYDDALDSLQGSMTGLQNTIGSALVPVVAGLAEAFVKVLDGLEPVIDFLAEVPGPIYLVVGAFIALQMAMKSTFVTGAISAVGTWAASMVTSFVAVGTGAVSMSGIVSGALNAMKAALLSNPITAVLVALAAGVALISAASKNATDEVKEMIPTLKAFEDQGLSTADAMSKTADKWYESASTWDKASMQWENWGWAKNLVTLGGYDALTDDAAVATANFEDKMQDLREELGEYEFQAQMAQKKQGDLNVMLTEGTHSNEELAEAVALAGDAVAEKKAIDEQASQMMKVYAQSTTEAVDATREVIDSRFDFRDAQRGVTESLEKYNEVLKDSESSVDDIAAAQDDYLQAVLDSADGAAEMQRQQDELNGIYRDTSYYTNVAAAEMQKYIESLPPDSPLRKELQGIVDDIRKGQEKAGEGIIIPISVEEKKKVEDTIADLQARAAAAFAAGDMGLFYSLQNEMRGLDFTLIPQQINAALATGNLDIATPLLEKYNSWAITEGLDTLEIDVDAETGKASLKVGGIKSEVEQDPVTIQVNAVTDQAKADVASVAQDKTAKVTVDVTNDKGAASLIDNTAHQRTAPIEIDILNDRGAGSILDNVAHQRTVPYMIDVLNERGASSVLDSLVHKRTAPVEIDITNDSGANWVLNNVARKRTAVIEIDVQGIVSANAQIAQIQRNAGATAMVSPNAFAYPQAAAPAQPVNIVKVSMDGQQFRAIIREEMGNVRVSDDLAAAMGVTA